MARAMLQAAFAMARIGQLLAAERSFREVLTLDPRNAVALYNLGVLLERRGERGAAMEYYARTLDAAPNDLLARLNRGALHLDAGRAEEALADFAILVAAAPTADHHTNRTRALFALHRDAEALESARAALAAEPDHMRARLDEALALACLGRIAEAEPVFDRLRVEAGPALEAVAREAWSVSRLEPRAMRLARMLEQHAVCDWSNHAELLEALRGVARDPVSRRAAREVGVLSVALSLPLSGPELRAIADAASEDVRARSQAIPPYVRLASPARKRIRVGFANASLREHPNAFLVRRLFLDHDRERFEFFLYGLGAGDGSAVRDDIVRNADAFVDMAAWDAQAIAARMRADALDILVDLSSFFVGSRPEVIHARVAPVQVAYLGLAATLGEAAPDYRLSDAYVTPEGSAANWAEHLVLLPHSHFAYDDGIVPGAPRSRADHGLPEDGFVFCSINQVVKLGPDVFDIWMRLLRAVPGSVLWLSDAGPFPRANLRRECSARGIAPERLVFAPRRPLEHHLGRLAHAGLFLDTLHYNAHTTALDTLWAGVPLLTIEGSTMASRIAASFLRCLGLESLVARTVQEYESKALMLAREPGTLDRVRQELAGRRRGAPLFDTAARVRALERAIEAIVARERAGSTPALLKV